MNSAENHCAVCGQPTRTYLFKDNELKIPICTYGCEQKFVDNLSAKQETRLLNHFDKKISQAKRRLKLCWIAAGVGVMVTLMGFLAKTVTVFVVGASLATFCAFLTRYLEERTVRLTRIRERISI